MAAEDEELMMEPQHKLVIKGLPFEAEVQDVVQHFNIDESCLQLITWSDSGRCKGHAFVTLGSEAEADRLREYDNTEFTVADNKRILKISDFVARPRRNNNNRGGGRGRGGRRGNRGGGRGRRGDGQPRQFEQDEESQREVYVSNVPWKADKEDFRRVFGQCGEIEDITIPTVYNSGKPKGFAFVRFATHEGRERAIQDCDGTYMMERQIGVRPNKGRPIGIKPRERKAPRTGLSEKPPGCTTIFVGNLPFEAEEKDLEALFGSCGAIRNARIVRQSWTNNSRGFGYVEFEEEASVDIAVQQQLELDDRMLRLDYTESIQTN